MTTTSLIKYKFEGSKPNVDKFYINGKEKQMPQGRRISKPIPEDLWQDMRAQGYPFQSLDYVITAKSVEYTYKSSKDHGYVEGVQLSGVEYVHSSGKTFKVLPKILPDCGNKPRERILVIGNDERQFVICLIPEADLTPEILNSPSFFREAIAKSNHLSEPQLRKDRVPQAKPKPLQLANPKQEEWDKDEISKLLRWSGAIAAGFGVLKAVGVL
jgi:hypothetical protein